MKFTDTRIGSIALVLVTLLALSMVAAPALAATTTLAGDGTDEVTGFTASNADHIEYDLASDGANFSEDGSTTLHFNVTHGGVEHHAVMNDTFDDTTSSHTFNASHADLSTVPGQAGGTTTVNVSAWGEDADGTVQTTVAEFEVDITFDDSRSVAYIKSEDDSAVDVEEYEEPSGLAAYTSKLAFWSETEDYDTYTLNADSRDVVGNTTVVYLKQDDSNITDGFSEPADAYSDSGDPILGMTVLVDGDPVPVFNSELNEDYASQSDTYAIYDSGDMEVHIGDEYGDSDTADIEAMNQDALDATDDDLTVEDIESAYGDELAVEDLTQEFSIRDIGITRWIASKSPLTLTAGALSGLSLGLVVPVAVRRRQGA